jgi:hypothetical protein
MTRAVAAGNGRNERLALRLADCVCVNFPPTTENAVNTAKGKHWLETTGPCLMHVNKP